MPSVPVDAVRALRALRDRTWHWLASGTLVMLATSPASAADLANSANFTQDITMTAASIVQRGDYEVAMIDQTTSASGRGNIASIEQDGIFSKAVATQVGDLNRVRIVQTGGDENYATVYQNGYGNAADLKQVGSRNIIDLTQLGSLNMADFSQTGSDNRITWTQLGNASQTITINGDHNTVTYDPSSTSLKVARIDIGTNGPVSGLTITGK